MFEEEKTEKIILKGNNKLNFRSKDYYDLIKNFRQYDYCLKNCSNNEIKDALTRREKYCLSLLKRKLFSKSFEN